MIDLFGKKKKKEDVVSSIISVSKVTSIQEISAISEFSQDEVCTIIEKLISRSKTDSSYKLFKNAYIDKKTNEVVIAKYAKGGTSGPSDILKGIFSTKADWKCTYCNAVNKGKQNKCTSCGAANS